MPCGCDGATDSTTRIGGWLVQRYQPYDAADTAPAGAAMPGMEAAAGSRSSGPDISGPADFSLGAIAAAVVAGAIIIVASRRAQNG